MASNTDNGGRSHNPSSSSLVQVGSPYQQTYSWSQQDPSGQAKLADKIGPPIAIAFAAFAAFIYLLCSRVLRTNTEEQEAAGGGDNGDNTVHQLQSNEAGGGRVLSSTVAGATAVEMAHTVQMADEPPLVCTYRKADGWREGSCGVCLADLDDGEVVRVLPACMHYFHAVCVGEWLRAHDTCPFCRAPLVAPTSAAQAASASIDVPAQADPTSVAFPGGRHEPRPRTLNPRYYLPAWQNA